MSTFSGSIAFDRAVEYYDSTRGFPPGVEQSVADLFGKLGNFTQDTRLLEIGIGTGRIALPLSPQTGAYLGIDLSVPMMERLRAKQTDPTTASVAVAQADMTRLPFANGSLDAVIAVHVFHLVADWRAAIDEAGRILKPGGIMLHGQNQHNRSNVKPLHEALIAAMPPEKSEDRFFQNQERTNYLKESGWQKIGEEVLNFSTASSPAQYLDGVKGRQWSSMWRLNDEEFEQVYAAVSAAVAALYPDPTVMLPNETGFEITVYQAPDKR